MRARATRAISLESERDENECILIWEQRQDDFVWIQHV